MYEIQLLQIYFFRDGYGFNLDKKTIHSRNNFIINQVLCVHFFVKVKKVRKANKNKNQNTIHFIRTWTVRGVLLLSTITKNGKFQTYKILKTLRIFIAHKQFLQSFCFISFSTWHINNMLPISTK